jgi:cytochrome b6-f complex iron-sulfur subunit
MAIDRSAQQSRRRFLRTGFFAALGISGVGGFGTALGGFLRSGPQKQTIEATEFVFRKPTEERPEPRLFSEPDQIGGFYVVSYPPAALPNAREVYSTAVIEGMEDGVLALSRRCTHQGQNVAWCISSQWFECPSHGAQFNAVGERKGGPAPRGMDHFAIASLGNSRYEVDRSAKFFGVPDETDTTGQKPEGPHCV